MIRGVEFAENDMRTKTARDPAHASIYLVGSGIASLASAVYLIQDAGVPPRNIHILEKNDVLGGALDGAGDAEHGFVVRGGRMQEEHFECYWDLLSRVASLEDPDISVRDESFEFSQRFITSSNARLLSGGKKLDVSSFEVPIADQARMLKLMLLPERRLNDVQIEDWFSHRFFESNFWHIFQTMFAFQKWSSVIEMKRYMERFIHLVPGLEKLHGVMRTKYNQYHSVVVPLVNYLRDAGVQFDTQAQVVDIDFDISLDEKTATVLHVRDAASSTGREIVLRDDDCVLVTLGSIVDATDNGSMTSAPRLGKVSDSGAWTLWKNIAAKDQAFGRPEVFCDDVDRQKWYSFSVTLKDATFHDYMENFTGNVDGTGGLVTMTDSNWLMSVVIARQPHFPNQPDDVKFFWGYGLYPDRLGNRVEKPMAECTGAEILEELWHHLGITDLMGPIVEDGGVINCIPTAMPFIDSLFMPRKRGDRPAVRPDGATNFAFLGQFVEVPHDCVFTVEYSVRCAQTAVYDLFETEKKVLPVFPSRHMPKYLLAAARAIRR